MKSRISNRSAAADAFHSIGSTYLFPGLQQQAGLGDHLIVGNVWTRITQAGLNFGIQPRCMAGLLVFILKLGNKR
jgi:hypothetical protein